LFVVIKAAMIGHKTTQSSFARVSERRVPKIMSQRDGLDQIFVTAQRSRKSAADLRDF
jgi:hypothetical protein